LNNPAHVIRSIIVCGVGIKRIYIPKYLGSVVLWNELLTV